MNYLCDFRFVSFSQLLTVIETKLEHHNIVATELKRRNYLDV